MNRDLGYELMKELRNGAAYWHTAKFLTHKFKTKRERVIGELHDFLQSGLIETQEFGQAWVRITPKGLKMLGDYEKQKGK